jgi:hypothetical protein
MSILQDAINAICNIDNDVANQGDTLHEDVTALGVLVRAIQDGKAIQ